MRARALLFCVSLCLGGYPLMAGTPYDRVVAGTTSTSIYIGSVTMHFTPFVRDNGGYVADYKAKVFPYFFMNEHGSLRINLSDEELARVVKGETVELTGRAVTSGNEERLITGRATPIDGTQGRIKVRVFVTKKIQLIFNTTYRFEGDAAAQPKLPAGGA